MITSSKVKAYSILHTPMESIEVFEEHAAEYDEWHDEHHAAYKAEILALRSLIPSCGTGLEVGAGTGRFAAPLGIKIGVEPAREKGRKPIVSSLIKAEVSK